MHASPHNMNHCSKMKNALGARNRFSAQKLRFVQIERRPLVLIDAGRGVARREYNLVTLPLQLRRKLLTNEPGSSGNHQFTHCKTSSYSLIVCAMTASKEKH